MPLFYNVVYALLKILSPVVRLRARWEIYGAENVPRKGPLLVVSNHMNTADILLLIVTLGRKSTFMAKEELFEKPVNGFFLSRLQAFPVRRGQMDIRAMRNAYEVLERGDALVIFPEGTRSREGGLKPALSGAAAIAQRSGAPILPVAMTGCEKLRGVRSLLHPPRVSITFGKPFALPPASHTKGARADQTDMIMKRIASLLPMEYRGVYGGERVVHEN